VTRLSVRLRATIVATLTVALALGATAAVLTGTLTGTLLRSADEDARRRLDAATEAITRSGLQPTEATPGVPVPVAANTDIVIARSDGGAWEPAAAAGFGYVTATGRVATENGDFVVMSRASLGPVNDALDALRPMLLIGTPVLSLLVGALTWLLLGQALKPVSAIREKFAGITAGDLHQRVPVPATRDEVARLARTMNATLDRLENVMERHKRFVADAAHELRSPLATLRTRLELGRRRAPELAEDALTDVARIQGLAADLLLLARLDAGEPLVTEEVDLGQVAAEEAIRPRRDDVEIVLDIADGVVVPGSRPHLARMVGNLVDNAVRHAESKVTVRVTPPAVLEVIDDGPGIPAEHRESVFDRFTRLDEARDRDAGGSGLGLAIARDIARAHHGTLVVTGEKGSCLRADLRPAADR